MNQNTSCQFWSAAKKAGFEACQQAGGDTAKSGGNPFERDTQKWKDWNVGWNLFWLDAWDTEAVA